jgi:NAD(P)-dependent dehydrogenase (short-subunit alcohol dehydrogenase family)
MAPLVWLITGTTSGIGTALVAECLSRGDKVIATGRRVEEKLVQFKTENIAFLELDVTAPLEEIQVILKKAWSIFGHIDILMNNAGISAFKAAEEAELVHIPTVIDHVRLTINSEKLIKSMFDVNLFGPMRMTQAMLPFFREQGHGVLGFTSSASLWTPLPFMSHYAASKAALSTYVEALHKETRLLNIRCIAFECGGFPTNLGQSREPSQDGFGSSGTSIEAYQPLFMELMGKFTANPMVHMPGDVHKAAVAMVDAIKQEGKAGMLPWTVRIPLGSDGLGRAEQRCEEQLQLLKRCQTIGLSTDREPGQGSDALKEMFLYHTLLN